MTMMTLEQYLTPDPNLRPPRECQEFMPEAPPSVASREMSLHSAISVHGYPSTWRRGLRKVRGGLRVRREK